MTTIQYGFVTALPGVAYADAVQRVTDELKKEGFGVLAESDVKDTLKKKLDVDFRRYVILGACNPPLAKQALEAEGQIGLLLPSPIRKRCSLLSTTRRSGPSPMKPNSVCGASSEHWAVGRHSCRVVRILTGSARSRELAWPSPSALGTVT